MRHKGLPHPSWRLRITAPKISSLSLVAEIVFREGRFERGLERLLDGIEAGLAP